MTASNFPVYLMIKPTPPARTHLGACRSWHRLDDSYALDRVHATIVRLGFEQDRPAAGWRTIIGLVGDFGMAPFPVAFDTLDGRLLRGARGCRGAAQLHRALVRHLVRAGIALPPQAFWLHLSLAYRGRECARKAIDPIRWQVDEFLLIRSVPGDGRGPGRHEVMGAWPLADRQLPLAL